MKWLDWSCYRRTLPMVHQYTIRVWNARHDTGVPQYPTGSRWWSLRYTDISGGCTPTPISGYGAQMGDDARYATRCLHWLALAPRASWRPCSCEMTQWGRLLDVDVTQCTSSLPTNRVEHNARRMLPWYFCFRYVMEAKVKMLAWGQLCDTEYGFLIRFNF